MGGIGSGNWMRGSSRLTAEACRRVDVRFMRKEGMLAEGSRGQLQWSSNGVPSGSADYQVRGGELLLRYKSRAHGEDWVEVEECVALERTSCHFGGERTWFKCPHCQKRVAVLYGAQTRFLCRHCYRLSYASQLEGDFDRLLRKARKLRKKLNASENLDEPLWRKPKGMHQKTFDAYVEQDEQLNAQMDGYIEAALSRLKTL